MGNLVSFENKQKIKIEKSTSITTQSSSVLNHYHYTSQKNFLKELCARNVPTLSSCSCLSNYSHLAPLRTTLQNCSSLGLKRYQCCQPQQVISRPHLTWPLGSIEQCHQPFLLEAHSCWSSFSSLIIPLYVIVSVCAVFMLSLCLPSNRLLLFRTQEFSPSTWFNVNSNFSPILRLQSLCLKFVHIRANLLNVCKKQDFFSIIIYHFYITNLSSNDIITQLYT